MKNLIVLVSFLAIASAQSELRGLWEYKRKPEYFHVLIYESNGKQFIDTWNSKWEIVDNKPIFKKYDKETKILHDPFFGESYYETRFLNQKTGKVETAKTEVISIDKNTILVGNTKYQKQKTYTLEDIKKMEKEYRKKNNPEM